MLHAINMGWFVLNKYYTMTEDVPVYAAALLLDLSKRVAYIQQNWPVDWHASALAGAHDIWIKEYDSVVIPREPERLSMPPPPTKTDNGLMMLFKTVEVKKKAVSTQIDNLDSFINAQPMNSSVRLLNGGSILSNVRSIPGSVVWPSIFSLSLPNQQSRKGPSQELVVLLRGIGSGLPARTLRRWSV
ncbi:hypothetical protein BKA66DRAFT_455922 [Pyrenochaeta sp. MPI-SDFR-AT-0127]|nr:hypothetical protein BKA66DRAFT_455922 [Pyrenochaeta sp. MPI-SDFR-AT-0127]